MKRFLAFILMAVIALSLFACDDGGENSHIHEWGEWEQKNAPTYAEAGEEVRACKGCSETESREVAALLIEDALKTYPRAIESLPFFDTVTELDAYDIVVWCKESVQAAKTYSLWDELLCVDVISHHYDKNEFDKITNKYFGHSWDYSTIENANDFDKAEYSYDAEAETVVITIMGAYGGPSDGDSSDLEYKGYTEIDATHFEVTYTRYFYKQNGEKELDDVKIGVELKDGMPFVTSHKRVEPTLDDLFKNYPYVLMPDEVTALGFFDSVNELTAGKVFMLAQDQVYADGTKNDGNTRIFKVETLNAYTTKYFGRNFDYSTAVKDNGSEKIEYNADAGEVYLTLAGGMGGMGFEHEYVGYEKIDDTHFVVSYKTNYDGAPNYDYSVKSAKMEIELIDGNYVIVSNKKV